MCDHGSTDVKLTKECWKRIDILVTVEKIEYLTLSRFSVWFRHKSTQCASGPPSWLKKHALPPFPLQQSWTFTKHVGVWIFDEYLIVHAVGLYWHRQQLLEILIEHHNCNGWKYLPKWCFGVFYTYSRRQDEPNCIL